MPAKRPPRPAPARRVTLPAARKMAQTHSAHDVDVRYRVLSGGVSTPSGAIYHGAIVTADELGDAERVQKLLDQGSIEVVDD
jgi:hypothetical protein